MSNLIIHNRAWFLNHPQQFPSKHPILLLKPFPQYKTSHNRMCVTVSVHILSATPEASTPRHASHGRKTPVPPDPSNDLCCCVSARGAICAIEKCNKLAGWVWSPRVSEFQPTVSETLVMRLFIAALEGLISRSAHPKDNWQVEIWRGVRCTTVRYLVGQDWDVRARFVRDNVHFLRTERKVKGSCWKRNSPIRRGSLQFYTLPDMVDTVSQNWWGY